MLNHKLGPIALVLSPLFTSLLLLSPHAHAAPPVFPVEVMFEAEAVTVDSPWSIQTANEASGYKYVVATGPGPTAAPATGALPELSYQIQVDHDAEYKIWLRVRAPGGNADSFHWAFDNAAYNSYFMGSNSSSWVWISLPKQKLSKGPHEFKLRYREAGMGFDRILVTAQEYYVPKEVGANPGLPVAMPDNPYGPAPAIVPPTAHPRLFLRETDLATLRQYRQNAVNNPGADHVALKAAWDRMEAAANSNTTGVLPAQGTQDSKTWCPAMRKVIQGKALRYLLDGSDVTSGQHAVSLMSAYLDTDACQTSTSTREIGESILLSSIVYDWCYPQMTQAHKLLFIQRFMERAPKMELGFPPTKQGSVSGHGGEAQLMRDQLSAGIAFYDEAPEIYRIVAGRFFKEFVDVRDDAYVAHAHHQGTSYGPYRTTWDLFAAWIFRRMGAGEVFSSEQKQLPYHWLYMLRPDGQLMRDGDSYQSAYTQQGKYWTDPMAYMLPASFYDDGIIKHEFSKNQLAAHLPENDLYLILFNKPDLAATPATLPLTRYFADPVGMMVARTGWSDSSVPDYASKAVVATMKVGSTQFEGHQQLDGGHFQLYYKGPLAIDSGIYEGTHPDQVSNKNNVGYGSDHDVNYHKRTIAHNAMLVLDPAETFTERFANAKANDGGQRFIGAEPFNKTALLDPAKSYVVGASLRHQVGPDSDKPDYSYLKGDLTKAYTAKMANYTRSFVFLNLKNTANPAALIVLDKVQSSNKDFKKTWLLHSIQEPQISGDSVTIERTVAGLYSGKLVNRTILPASAQIGKIGGPGKEFAVYNPVSKVLVNYPMLPSYTNATEEPGAWRVEVSPAQAAESDLFLNAMQVMDAGSQNLPLATEPIAADLLTGVKISNRVVLFAKGNQDISANAEFTLPATNGETRVLVTDLAPGFWSVSLNGAAATVQYEVKAGEGTLYFIAASGGSYALTRAASRTLPAPQVINSL